MSKIKPVSDDEAVSFRETLKRCPEGTYEALIRFRANGEIEDLNEFIVGVIKRHTEEEYHSLLDGPRENIAFIDDLGIDSMTMMEIVMMVEECLGFRLENQDLIQIRTYGALEAYISTKLELQT
ncbi:MAG: phosphopantetheine-binding protein [Verrucomicrobiota bacterium]